jgi:hypothetical protein
MGSDAGPVIETTPPAAIEARINSSEWIDQATGKGQPDHTGCMPEPVSTILMTSGLLGLAAKRRFSGK